SSKGFEWDTACPGDQWRHSHNYMHHTHTNIVGKDRDIGYGILRMSEDQPWRPYYLGNPIWATLLATFFQYGVALHDVEVERIAEPRGLEALPHPVRQPQPPDRASPVPRSAREPVCRDLGRGARDLRALRDPVQQRAARKAVLQRRQEDLPARTPEPRCRGST